ncbi:hypothetical protein HK098_000548 [Nowakowskiella sp. JEL0407]|nr:hypothetical protein HK098_000548 [Nowakowskiella sp. JEL0407]
MLVLILCLLLELLIICRADRIDNWIICHDGDTCNSGYQCCVGIQDASTQKKTCRPRNYDCIHVVKLRENWKTCHDGDLCNPNFVCCVGVLDVDSGKKTCRPINGDCSKDGNAQPSPVISPSPNSDSSMPSEFRGENVGIGSWFQANTKDSDTNGNSWCGYPYQDYTLGFSPDISRMTGGKNYVWSAENKEVADGWMRSATEYCGLEAIVTNPSNGISRTLYIVDAFDHKWVRSPGSIDIMYEEFQKLFGRPTSDHNDVIKDIKWTLTGKRSSKYSFKGPGDPN